MKIKRIFVNKNDKMLEQIQDVSNYKIDFDIPYLNFICIVRCKDVIEENELKQQCEDFDYLIVNYIDQ